MKKRIGKLRINKDTIANLNNRDLARAAGAGSVYAVGLSQWEHCQIWISCDTACNTWCNTLSEGPLSCCKEPV